MPIYQIIDFSIYCYDSTLAFFQPSSCVLQNEIKYDIWKAVMDDLNLTIEALPTKVSSQNRCKVTVFKTEI